MHALTLSLGAVLIAAPLAPALAIDPGDTRSSFSGRDSRHSDRFGNFAGAPVRCDVDRRDGRRGDGRRHRGGDDCIAGGWGWYGGEWALYNNRSWESDSYNDWWHDRPDRAFPRWVQTNQNCERIWSSGSGWRC